MLLAFDDTDALAGGCTTHLVLHILLALPELAPRSLPRLVRLNPNVPHKTRGNGAVVLDLGLPAGPGARFGELRGHELRVFPEAPPAPATPDVLERAWNAIEAAARPEAHPSVVALDAPAPEAAYWQAVRTRVDPAEARNALEALGARHRSRGDGRALVGCLAALAWPGPPSSYEFLAYREPQAVGTPRRVATGRFPFLDASGATFHSFDVAQGRAVGVPRTPCPVLCGLRGRDPDQLAAAAGQALLGPGTEAIDAWLLFATNHGSGDHVTPVAALSEAPEWGTVLMRATVTAAGRRRAGGHAVAPMADDEGVAFEAIAFEPTHALRDVVSALRPGDEVTVVGAAEWRSGTQPEPDDVVDALASDMPADLEDAARAGEDLPDHDAGDDGAGLHTAVGHAMAGSGGWAVRLEKLEVRALADARLRADNPVCSTCGLRMPSMGRGAGHRCRKCGARLPAGSAVGAPEARTLAVGWHEASVMARRHLHRPVAWDAGVAWGLRP